MKQLFRNKFFIAFLLVGAILGIILIWGAYKSKDTMGLKLDIPELQGKPVKSIHFENDSLVIQSVTILKDKKFINYLMLKTSSSSPIDKLSQSEKFKVGSTSYLERSGFKIWDYPPISKKIDFSYYTKDSPIEQKKIGDSILIQKYHNMEAEISLTDEKKRNVSMDITSSSPSRPFSSTLVLYKRSKDLYFISVNTSFGSEQWIPQDELVKTVYLLVKNWDVYERR